eukprot:NODE_12274_length_283_cov_15.837607_g11361_i0.p2 GENE.NODE_12274_length_283_cov_15.837607_g11361_i0~~NODE_12274_length_283_cov_15.837607_g11361_i0.p2  ORF type:complete len:54 (+),score=2.61 NODE_12274_length_283_cov_15.837607_g11361_i0:55-216(+)
MDCLGGVALLVFFYYYRGLLRTTTRPQDLLSEWGGVFVCFLSKKGEGCLQKIY